MGIHRTSSSCHIRFHTELVFFMLFVINSRTARSRSLRALQEARELLFFFLLSVPKLIFFLPSSVTSIPGRIDLFLHLEPQQSKTECWTTQSTLCSAIYCEYTVVKQSTIGTARSQLLIVLQLPMQRDCSVFPKLKLN